MTFVPPPPPQDPNAPQDPNQQPGYGYPQYPPPGYSQQGYPPPGYPQYPPPGYQPMPPAPPGMPPYGFYAPVPGGRNASMGARLGGYLLDGLILAVPNLILTAVTGGFHTKMNQSCDTSGLCTTTTSINVDWAAFGISLVIGLVYFGYFVGVRTQTWGQQAVGIRVVDVTTGNPIGFGRALLRWVVLGLTGALCTLGFWSPFFDSARRQGWHDKAVDSVVIPAPGH